MTKLDDFIKFTNCKHLYKIYGPSRIDFIILNVDKLNLVLFNSEWHFSAASKIYAIEDRKTYQMNNRCWALISKLAINKIVKFIGPQGLLFDCGSGSGSLALCISTELNYISSFGIISRVVPYDIKPLDIESRERDLEEILDTDETLAIREFKGFLPRSIEITNYQHFSSLMTICVKQYGLDEMLEDYKMDYATHVLLKLVQAKVFEQIILLQNYCESCQNSDDTLLLSWPEYEKEDAYNKILNTQATKIIYIGEYRGCCATEQFFDELEKNWLLVEEYNSKEYINSISGIICFYIRKDTCDD